MLIDVSLIPEVMSFLDYRKYLGVVYQSLKGKDPNFSFRFFSRVAGFRSPNFIQLLILGRRNVSSAGARKIAKALKLQGDAFDYFLTLVAFGQETSAETKAKLAEKLLSLRTGGRAFRLADAQFKYYRDWYLVVLREWVASPGFKDDPAWLAARLDPPLTAIQVQEGLEQLEALGLIANHNGKWCQTETILSSGDEVSHAALGHWHQQMLKNAARALEVLPSSVRETQSYTTLLSKEGFTKLVKEVRDFQRRIWAIGEEDRAQWEKDPGRVYQIGFQAFPLTRDLQLESQAEQIKRDHVRKKRGKR